MAFMKEKHKMFVNKAACVKHGRKHRYIKPVSLLLAAILLCGMTGCSKNEVHISEPESSLSGLQSIPNESSALDDASSEEINSSASSAEFNSDVLSEQNRGKINPEIMMDGHLITLPCNVEDIQGITIDREYSFAVVPAENGIDEYSTAFFYYNNVRAGLVFLEGDCSEMSDLGNAKLIGIRLNDDRVPMSYSGLTYDSGKDDIIRTLGNPDRSGDIAMNYNLGVKGSVLIGLGTEDKITSVAIFLYLR